jgi:hypothetical protein
MVIVNNYLFGTGNTGPFSDILVGQGKYNLDIVRKFSKSFYTNPIFSFKNIGWVRALNDWSNLTETEKADYASQDLTGTQGGFKIFLIDNLLLSYPFSIAEAPENPLFLSSEVEEDEGNHYIKVKYERVFCEIPSFEYLEFLKLYKGVDIEPLQNPDFHLITSKFDPVITQIGDRWKVSQLLINDWNVQAGHVYFYHIYTTSYTIKISLIYRETISII